jgi:ParB family chromosome partitioning protein
LQQNPRESYLDHVSKSRIGEIVATAVSPEVAMPLVAMKKDMAAEAAELRLANTGWLPEILRTPTRTIASGFEDGVRDAA